MVVSSMASTHRSAAISASATPAIYRYQSCVGARPSRSTSRSIESSLPGMKLPLGFEFKEEMAGTWTPPDGGAERPIRFSLRATADDLARYLRDHTVTLRGTLEAEGLAANAP